jgi:spore maturation protein CgeB
MFDYFFCSLKGVSDKMQEVGYKNAYYLDEACDPELNGETYLNYFQQRKYGEDISFIGSLGFHGMHIKRVQILKKIVDEGFNLKIWGAIVGPQKLIPQELLAKHVGTSVVNDQHSMVVQASLVNLGIDQDNDVELGHSARLYRVLCAGGLYLCGAVKGLEKMFRINKEGEEISEHQDLVVYYDENDLVKKLDFLLENVDIAEKIARNGRVEVLTNHTFDDRIKEMIKTIGGK